MDVTAADIDHDGDLDLATVGGNVLAGASVFLNNGNGTFVRTQFSMPQAPANPVSVTLADLDGDGNLDIVTADQSGCTPWGATSRRDPATATAPSARRRRSASATARPASSRTGSRTTPPRLTSTATARPI